MRDILSIIPNDVISPIVSQQAEGDSGWVTRQNMKGRAIENHRIKSNSNVQYCHFSLDNIKATARTHFSGEA